MFDGVVAVVRDITEHRMYNEALHGLGAPFPGAFQ